ncbi:hypothetical protein FB45DRAFT_938019 [Roridomyces roridus]|uniref:Protein kinase domain-containing protein n=1 Tax=Roridomyces roridus TaxID=1738132 RepID=A0AAD7FDP7_9AGAR|nr:hypothetical protein FB45DRAFT_938019 [Roridomyces roridus]
MEVATPADGSVVASPPPRPAQMFTEASGLDLTGSHFTNVSGDMHIHHHATPSTSTPGFIPQGSRSQVLPAPSRQDVLYSDSESYCSQLLRCGRGFPLYLPGPGGNFPPEYQRHGVSIGDVGSVTPRGGFDFLFNIYLPVDDPVNVIGTPENFCPLTPRYVSGDITPVEYSAEDYVSTRSSLVKLDTGPQPIDFAAMESFVFDCCGPQGAVLTIPLGSHVEELVNVANMKRYARENAESWYQYANGARGRQLTNGSLYLVTGWEKALIWGRASFQDLSAQSTFRLAFEPTPTARPGPSMDDHYNYGYRWTAAGPARTKSYGSLPQTAPLNQTVFIHGYSISLGSSIWGKFFKDVQISQIVDSRLGRHNKDWVPYGPQGFSISWALGFSGGGGSGRGTQYAGEQQGGGGGGDVRNDVGIADIAPTKQLFRPSQVINDYILRKCPDAEVVMTHDDDWRDILRSDGTATYSDEAAIELLYRACETFTLVEEDGLATIRRPDPVREIIERLSKLFRDNQEWYTRFLACRSASAQWLLDRLQDLLDCDASSAPTDRHRLVEALLRLSADSGLYPSCVPLPDLGDAIQVGDRAVGDVWMGHLRGQCVAVTVMPGFGDSNIDAVLKGFGRQAIIWRQLSHPNLLPFYGLYKFRHRLCLVSPWMENRDIRAFLKEQMWETDRLLSLILDVALGLEHLHAMHVTYGDLSIDNILVTSSGRVCIADFGLASIFSSIIPLRAPKVRYPAPELHRNGSNKDRRSDIYSFALVVYEILAEPTPFRQLPIESVLMRGGRPSRPPACSGTPALEGLWALVEDCWHADPDSRPTAAQVVERLRGGDIGASESSVQSENDWDSTSISKFRRLLRGKQALPTLDEFENVVYGTVRASQPPGNDFVALCLEMTNRILRENAQVFLL